MTIDGLIKIAERSNIHIDYMPMPLNKSASIMLSNGECYICIDSRNSSYAGEKVRLAHELGHCKTNSFYGMNSDSNERRRNEYKANKWAVQTLLPKEAMEDSMKKGYREVWQLAEYFNVTEEFIKFALWIYFDKIL